MDPRLPFIDLHRHLDGNVRLQTILDLGRQHNIRLPGDTLETLRPHVQVTEVMPDLVTWLAKLNWMIAVLGDYDACRRIARENVEDAHAEGLDYVELRFSPYFMAGPNKLDPVRVVEAVVAGVEEGRARTGLPVKLIGILSRTFGPEACRIELEALLSQRAHLVALDLAGDEKNWPAELFVEHFKRGRDAGWAITVHAGEAGGAPSVWAALEKLGATRIGHGIRAIDDPRLLDHLRERRIGLEVNLTSNVQTNTVPGFADHPMKRFLGHGLLATINTDDPVISGIDLRHEFTVAAPAAGLTPDEIALAQRHALEIAFLTRHERTQLAAREM
ncbi:adenosine deaminase [Oleiharenicola lentus]|uniref:adenosine deaminase n=1 Tax=Oleiharenicola lentus TaxID=2508720 RepID=A0A4Q1C4R2_9BACT|nr:adenosine deaminase [Oleiharenicola lentus]RXK53283.1 adenosine deaminase [Oleiharenicola lentus]